MNEDCLKLTTYFGERDRTGAGLFSDVLLDLYGRREIVVSALFRGTEGFGARHSLRTDRLLSLSEDLPVVSVAVDTRPRIEAILPELQAIGHRGLVTLERARLLDGAPLPEELPHALRDEAKLTVYAGRQERTEDGAPAVTTVCDLLRAAGLSGATVLLGVDGTRHGRRLRARFFGANRDVPVMIIAVGAGEAVGAAAAAVIARLRRPIVTLERVRICRRDGESIAAPDPLPAHDERGRPLWQKLMIHSSERARYDGHPLHRALVRALRSGDAAGATTLRGVWGFDHDGPAHGDRLLQIQRHTPLVTVVIDSPERIAAVYPLVERITAESGLVTAELVPAVTTAAPGRPAGPLHLARHRR